MISNDPSNWMLLIAMSYLLGLRHGFDLDHLATIDAMTRAVKDKRYLSRMAGCLFSLGHGFIIIIISLIVGSGLVQSHTPLWLDSIGKWISIIFLFAFGLLNLWNIFQNPAEFSVPVGIKSFLTRRLNQRVASPLTMILIGALFAFSFDTFSQVALFSLSASLLAGWAFSGILGLCFTIGMMTSDGLNGLLVSAVIQRADTASIILSRGLGIAISLFSLIIGMISLQEILL